MAVVHPLEQAVRLRALVRVDGSRSSTSVDDVADALAHRRPVLDGRAHVAEHPADAVASRSSASGLGLAVDLDVDQRLGLPVLGADLEQPALLVPADAHDRADHEVDRASASRHLHRDRVDEERHVVDDRLDDGVRPTPSRAPRASACRRAPSARRGAGPAQGSSARPRRRRGRASLRSFRSSGATLRVVRADEPLDVFGLVAFDPLADARDRGLEERRLPLIWLRRQSPTSLRVAVRSMD